MHLLSILIMTQSGSFSAEYCARQKPKLMRLQAGPRIISIYVRFLIRTYRGPGGPEGHVLIRTNRPLGRQRPCHHPDTLGVRKKNFELLQPNRQI